MIITRTREVKLPTRGTKGSAGLDFYVPDGFNNGHDILLMRGESILIPSGIKLIVPENHALIFFNKSGVSVKERLQVGACVVDEDYRDEVHIHVFNTGQHDAKISPGQKLIQGLLIEVNMSEIDEVSLSEFRELTLLGDLERTGGFGSTGSF